MKYDPNKHLLRPLEEGEIIEPDDVFLEDNTFIQSPAKGIHYKMIAFYPHFRPVPIPTWHPRSEAGLIKEAPKDSLVCCLWDDGESMIGTAAPDQFDGYSYFYIIPPCYIFQTDPERERFEVWKSGFDFSDTYSKNPSKEQDLMMWSAWQAARKEGAV